MPQPPMRALSDSIGKGRLNFFLVAAAVFAINANTIQSVSLNLDAREVFEKSKVRAMEIDNNLRSVDIQFTQEMQLESRGGNSDRLVFKITVRHGKFERQLISSTVANGDRFNGGYDAFDRMFFLYDYFSDEGKTLTSCEFQKSDCHECYGINFSLSKSSDPSDPVNVVGASLNANDYTPIHIKERVSGLPLGAEFDDDISVTYDKNADIYFPENIVMRVYARLYFLKGEIGVITIKNEGLQKI